MPRIEDTTSADTTGSSSSALILKAASMDRRNNEIVIDDDEDFLPAPLQRPSSNRPQRTGEVVRRLLQSRAVGAAAWDTHSQNQRLSRDPSAYE